MDKLTLEDYGTSDIGTVVRVLEDDQLDIEWSNGGVETLYAEEVLPAAEAARPVSITDAAAECGVSVETFIDHLAQDGMLLEHPDGGYVASPHPDIQRM